MNYFEFEVRFIIAFRAKLPVSGGYALGSLALDILLVCEG